MSQKDSKVSALPAVSLPTPPAPIANAVLPRASSGFLPPPPTSVQFIVRTSSASLTPQPSLDFDDDDDDWDDFQAHEAPGDASRQPVSEKAEEIDEFQASFPQPCPTLTNTVEAEERGANQSSTATKCTPPPPGAVEEWEDEFISAHSLPETLQGRVATDGKLEDESSVSSHVSNSTAFASPSASRVPEALQPESNDDMWDSFESATVTQIATGETTPESFDKGDDDDIWDSSLPDDVDQSGKRKKAQEGTKGSTQGDSSDGAQLENGGEDYGEDQDGAKLKSGGEDFVAHAADKVEGVELADPGVVEPLEKEVEFHTSEDFDEFEEAAADCDDKVDADNETLTGPQGAASESEVLKKVELQKDLSEVAETPVGTGSRANGHIVERIVDNAIAKIIDDTPEERLVTGGVFYS